MSDKVHIYLQLKVTRKDSIHMYQQVSCIGPDKENLFASNFNYFLPINLNMCLGAQKNRLIEMRNKENNFPIRTLIWRPVISNHVRMDTYKLAKRSEHVR